MYHFEILFNLTNNQHQVKSDAIVLIPSRDLYFY